VITANNTADRRLRTPGLMIWKPVPASIWERVLPLAFDEWRLDVDDFARALTDFCILRIADTRVTRAVLPLCELASPPNLHPPVTLYTLYYKWNRSKRSNCLQRLWARVLAYVFLYYPIFECVFLCIFLHSSNVV